MDKVTAQGNIVLGDAERNLTHVHASSPKHVILQLQSPDRTPFRRRVSSFRHLS
jgi:hypothetical protein